MASISVVALSFIVQEPSGIIGLTAVAGEHRVRQVLRGAHQRRGNAEIALADQLSIQLVDVEASNSERRPDVLDVGAQRDLVSADPDGVLVNTAQVYPAALCGTHDLVRSARYAGENGVEEVRVNDVYPCRLQTCRHQASKAVRAMRDPTQPLRPVVHGVHACHHGQQHLCRTDVAGRLLATDVLFAGLKR
jgi:hypothetical protein